MATTDARGRFSLTALRAGRYYVTVSKPGYVTVTYGQRRVNSQGTPIPLGEGEQILGHIRESGSSTPAAAAYWGRSAVEGDRP